VLYRLPISDLEKLKIPKSKISLNSKSKDVDSIGEIKRLINEFKSFIKTMLASAISEAILYQFLVDSGVPANLFEGGLGGLIKDIELGNFHKQEGRNFPLEPFKEFK